MRARSALDLESGLAVRALQKPLWEGQEESLTGKGGSGPESGLQAPECYSFAFLSPSLWSTVTLCRACPPSPSSSAAPSSLCLPPLMSSTYIATARLPGYVTGWANSCPVSQLTSGQLWGIPRGRAEGEQEFRDPNGFQGTQGGASSGGGRSPQCSWLCPYVLCLLRTMATAGWGSRPLTCPPPMGSPCGFWETSSSRSITLSMIWPTVGWALPSPPRQERQWPVPSLQDSGTALMFPWVHGSILNYPDPFCSLSSPFLQLINQVTPNTFEVPS